ncbi:glycoside hydrolase domain-containing protein [Nesterenkonia sp. HG001]|uniref:glycoside hydrolase domain-containing protein n=1 Tax=Nesterenkonia sp. HG001 TaxID=2983207 RepID=UPI002AC58239|nr:glycoside hydrolase domain-containing protein [Nesterenkonia sp. HG001]MDZ5076899.1 glycoside hydrolase family 92 protein [Nesterenkonia sp. HG001]
MTSGEIRPGSGPVFSPTSATGQGLLSPQPLLLSVPAGQASVALPLPGVGDGPASSFLGAGLVGRRIRAEDELTFAVLPEAGDATEDPERRWAATAVTVDVLLDDGTRLSAHGVTDQYGAALDPEAQARARRTWVDQWNLRTVALRPVAGRSIAEVQVRATADPGAPIRCWIDAIAIGPGAPVPRSLVDAVDIRRGTHSSGEFSRGNNAPLVCVPHGGLFGLPMTDASAGNWPYSYQAHSAVDPSPRHGEPRVRPQLQGFGTSHLPSPWMGDRGVFILAPTLRSSAVSAPADEARRRRALWFDHAEESPHAHQYEVRLEGEDDAGRRRRIEAALTAAHHGIGLALDYEVPGSLCLDHRGLMEDLSWQLEDGVLLLEGTLHDRENTPALHVALRVEGVTSAQLSTGDVAAGLCGHLSVGAGHVEAVVGISSVSPTLARAHRDGLPDVATMGARARQSWSAVLDRMQVAEPTLLGDVPAQRDRLTTLASSLYRVWAYPQRSGEPVDGGGLVHRAVAGEALRIPITPHGAPEVAAGELTVTNGFWDTYRTEWPLLALLDPVRAGELADGLLAHARHGGWVPRWSAPGPCDIMTGTSSDVVLADLLARQVPGVNWAEAYRTAARHAFTAPPDDRVGRKGLRPAIFRGHVDTATDEGLSWTLDNAINDAGAALLARHLLETDADLPGHDLAAEAEHLERRGLAYQDVFHPEHQFFIGRRPDGAWRVDQDFDPDVWGHDYTETNAWGTRVTAPHDPLGLAELFGSEAALGEALDEILDRPELAREETSGSYGFVIHEQREARDCRQGMLALSNQPAHHMPFMLMAAGRHDDAHRVLGDALDRLFVGSDLGQGHPGDEDNGEMSAWWLFVSLGLYPLVPASGEYVLTPPRWRSISLQIPGASAPLRVTTDGPLPGAGPRFIQEVLLDAEPWERISVPHARLRDGAHLHISLSDRPQGWASDTRPRGLSDRLRAAGRPDTPLRDALAAAQDPAHAPLVDDVGQTAVELAPGESVVLEALRTEDGTTARRTPLYTLSSARAETSAGWQLHGITAGGGELLLDERTDERFDQPRSTRPFLTRAPVTPEVPDWAAVRLTAGTALALEQVELFLD